MRHDVNQEYIVYPPDNRKADEWITALLAAGITFRTTEVDGRCQIHVASNDRVIATEEIAAYEADNLDWPPPGYREPVAVPAPHGTWAHIGGVLLVAGWYAWLGPFRADSPVLAAAAAQSAGVLRGEWWRVVTALMTHAGIDHIAGNVLCLYLFARAVCRLLGGGVGWALILASGILGNLLTALIFRTGHVSVGASTACFGAVGILCGCQAVRNLRHYGGVFSVWNRTWIPIGAGLGLLTMLGLGPNSDLAAHAFGFAAGIALSIPIGYVDTQRLPPWLQPALQLACLLIVLLAWRAAFLAAT